MKLIRRTKSTSVGLIVTLLLLLAGVVSAYGLELPRYHGYVNDYGDMISPQAESSLQRVLQSFDLSDSTQIAVLTVPSLEGEVLEEFGIKVAEKWGIGRKGKDNGVLLLVAKKERKVRIEVGRGLEPVLTDLLSGRIIDNVITPSFKAGELDKGFLAGVEAIVKATRGEFKGGGPGRESRGGEEPSPLFKFLFFGMIFAVFMGANSRKLGMITGAAVFPLAYLFGLAPTMSLLLFFLLIPVGAFGAGWLLPMVMGHMLSSSGSVGRGGGYYHGGGGFGGGGGGFGGFGGGGFGGGGASGGW